eukprot:m.741595 g.741595  ORF g.741595 m.741595 type:complete len:476 (+) comp23116_c3_seq85:358-1785(+)
MNNIMNWRISVPGTLVASTFPFLVEATAPAHSTGNWAIGFTYIFLALPLCVFAGWIAWNRKWCDLVPKKKVMLVHTTIVGVLGWIFAVAATSHTSLYNVKYENTDITKIGIGIWKVEVKATSGNTMQTVDCGKNFDDTDCGDSMQSKCEAWKGFSVMGILAIAAAVICTGLLLLEAFKPSFTTLGSYKRAIQVLGLGCAGFAEMALCIVWIIAVQIYHGFENLSDSRCGLDAITRQYASQTPKSEKFGASFGLFVVAWLFVTTMMLLLALTPNEMMDTGSEDSNYCHGKLKCTNCGAEMVPTYSSAVSEDDSTPAHARRQISRAGSTDRGGALANLVYVRPDPTGVDTDDTLGFDDPADSPSNRTCAYTNAQGRGCILPPLSSANYCSAHQCPIPLCRGGKDPHVPVCPDCATACARSISSARAQQAMPLPTVVSTVAADASATLPSPPITIPPPLEYYGTLGTEQYANPRQSAV